MTTPHQPDGGPAYAPAFPVIAGQQVYATGLTKRDWFAGQALMGILAGHFADTIPHDDISGGREAAYYAYQYADAMLAAREGGVS
ncbi:hypothetical protein [Paracoccus sp. (in: a-proteobacteria)]|uniref:hypothetical protein n=1 Tax=Paracoccus sp. TaxID=267 RepID=UPI0028A918B9|nr:hypothetical protein [Paracoccus sp. (in: a-proteobacteria)]